MCSAKSTRKNWAGWLTAREDASELWSLALMVDRGEVLGVVIAPVIGAGRPKETKLALRFSTTKPVKAQVHRLEALGDDGVVDDTVGRRVVCLDGRRALGPAHLDQRLAQRNHGPGALEESTELGFRR